MKELGLSLSKINLEINIVIQNAATTDDNRRNDDHANEIPKLPQALLEPFSEQVVNIFLRNTIVKAKTDSSTSKGHFSGLVELIQTTPRTEALPHSLEAVAMASLGTRLCNAELRVRAMRRYAIAVRLLRAGNWNSNSKMPSMMASILLLSIYEILNTTSDSNFNWMQHLHGVIAVLHAHLRRNQMCGIGIPGLLVDSEMYCHRSRAAVNANESIPHTVSNPARYQFDDLWLILPKVQGLFKRSADVLQPHAVRYDERLRQYRSEANEFKSILTLWSSIQSEPDKPQATNHFTQYFTLRFPDADDLICPVTRADTFKDFFTACMWISYCQCQLHLADLIVRINRLLCTNPSNFSNSKVYIKSCKEIQGLIDDVCASIPFMLTDGTHGSNKPTGSLWPQARPPLLLGGLNLQWVLFTISILESVQPDAKQRMKTILLWLGSNLGIGHATTLAQMDKNIPGGITAKGDALRWMGFLV